MKKIKLTETDLMKIVKRVIKENEKNLDEFFFEKDKNDETDHIDEFMEEISQTLKMAKKGYWDFFSPPTSGMRLDSLIDRIREICDEYEKIL